MSERKKLETNKWLIEGEVPLIKRLSYRALSSNPAPQINENNKKVRDIVFEEILSDLCTPRSLPDILNESSDDIVIGEIDRYGLPLRTIINQNTGIVRSDPYYSNEWLNKFYSKYYRELYTNRNNLSYSSIISEQISRGESYLKFVKDYLFQGDKVLEVGCGMGGILLPFKLNGFYVKGIDLGEEFIMLGNNLNLNLSVATIDDIIERNEKYNLVVLSHLIEHITDLKYFFEKIKKVLAPRGKVFIAVPGIKMIHDTYNSNLLIYLQNAHCWSFSKITLNAFLLKNGFTVLKSDDQINCLIEIGSDLKELDSISLKDEANFIINYLIKIENDYLTSLKSSDSLLKKIKRKIYNYLK